MSEGARPDDPGHEASVGAAEAVEAAVEGIPAAISLAPSSVIPALGGELVLPSSDGTAVVEGDVASNSVRAGLLQAGPLALAGLLANASNVIVTVALARLLITSGYGALNQLTGLFLIVSMPGSAVIVAVVRRVTGWRGMGAAHLVRRWAARVHRQGAAAVAVFAIAVFSARNFIAHTLGQRNAVGAVAILVAGALWILLSLDRGLLQSHRNYRTLSANLVVEASVRTTAMLCLVGAGFGVSGAAIGVLIAEFVTVLHARVTADRVWSAAVRAEEARGVTDPGLRRNGSTVTTWLGNQLDAIRKDPTLITPVEERRDLLRDLVSAFIALATLALLQNIDVIVIGRENSRLSGSYAAVSVSRKALVFGAIVLGGYLLPEAAIRWRQGGHALRQLAVTLLLLAIPASVLLLAAVAFPHFLLSTVFSSRYLGAESAFASLVLAMICLSGTVVLTMYLLAVGRRWITGVLVLGGIAATFAVVYAHGAPLATAHADLLVQSVLLVVTVIGFASVHHRRLRPRPGAPPRT